MEDKQLFTTQEVAQELGVSDAYIRVLIARGQAHPKAFGKAHMFTKEELERLRNRPKSKGGRPKK